MSDGSYCITRQVYPGVERIVEVVKDRDDYVAWSIALRRMATHKPHTQIDIEDYPPRTKGIRFIDETRDYHVSRINPV